MTTNILFRGGSLSHAKPCTNVVPGPLMDSAIFIINATVLGSTRANSDIVYYLTLADDNKLGRTLEADRISPRAKCARRTLKRCVSESLNQN